MAAVVARRGAARLGESDKAEGEDGKLILFNKCAFVSPAPIKLDGSITWIKSKAFLCQSWTPFRH